MGLKAEAEFIEVTPAQAEHSPTATRNWKRKVLFIYLLLE